MTKMKAAVVHSFGQPLTIEEVDVPAGPAGQVLGFCCDSAAGCGKIRRRQWIRKPASRTCLLRTRLDL